MSRSYKNTVIAVLLACILTMAIGYAVLNTRLSISGTSKITSDFNIQIVDINEFLVQQLAETADMDFTPTSATYSANLQAPGDGALYEIVIENKGSISGYVEMKSKFGKVIYNELNTDSITLGVSYVSKIKLDKNNLSLDNSIYPGITFLTPGEKLYVYAQAYFKSNATTLPSEKEFSNTIEFNFTSIDNELVPDSYGPLVLLDSIYNKFPVSTTGTGLRQISKYDYAIMDNGETDVNNYVKIDGQMWRLLGFHDSPSDSDYYYFIQDDDTINTPQVFSTVADSNGLYNNFTSSTLIYNVYTDESLAKEHFSYEYLYNEEDFGYVQDTELFAVSNDGVSTILNITNILNASSNTNCSINNLSTGGCKSWLTNNGNTYLVNPIFESDKTTNTGNIAYLKDNKVIAVDPQDTNYGEYKVVNQLRSRCNYPVFYANSNADGSKQNPYILYTLALKNMPQC